ncbi:MAG: M28 family metallopeptidase [Euryarchaeota archaeon]|nr:M28 family metallopeptidase [Euryarchaeota archaeon]
MSGKLVSSFAIAIMLLSTLLAPIVTSENAAAASIDTNGSIMDLVDKDILHGYAEDIVAISEDNLAYRVAGSEGANETADHILSTFQGFGLDSRTESFDFTNWDLNDRPSMTVDADGDWATVDDQVMVTSFSSESYSLSSNLSDPVKGIAYLPLPEAETRTDVELFFSLPYRYWNDYNLTDEIVIVPKEIRWNNYLESTLIGKLSREGPAGVIFSWYYDWNSDTPDIQLGSAGGRPFSYNGDYLWSLGLSCGVVNYTDGEYLRSIVDSGTPQVNYRINSTLYQGQQTNVIATIPGDDHPEKQLLITAHYDSVMCSGYIDNAAGVAAMLETARVMKIAYDSGTWKPEISVVFVAFAAEELSLVGSAYFVTANEIGGIVGVINLDSIGSQTMQATHPASEARIGIDEFFEEVADQEDVPFEYSAGGASDQASFISPGFAVGEVFDLWGTRFSLTTSDEVPDSVLVTSSPLFMDEGDDGMIGLAHTRLDVPNPEGHDYWNAKERLYQQSRVIVGVSVFLLSGAYTNDISEPTWQPYVFAIAIIVAVGILFMVFRNRIKGM